MSVTNAKRFKRIVELEIKHLNEEKSKGITKIERVVDQINKQNNNTWVTEDDSKPFDPNDILDEKYQVKSAGNHFYEIGLSLINTNNGKKLPLHNVYSNFTLLSIIIIRCIISLSIGDHENMRIYLGDFAYFLDVLYHFNYCSIFMFLTDIDSILINWFDYKGGRDQVHLKLFRIISGQCSPESMGMTNEKDIIKMTKVFKIGIYLVNGFTANMLIVGTILSFAPLISSYRWYELIIFGLPWSTIFTVTLYIGVKIFSYQILYCYITCFYLNSKLKQINLVIKNKTKFKSRRFNEILCLVKKLTAIYNEINIYNKRYWAKISLSFIRSLSLVSNLLIFLSIFSSINIYLKIVFSYLGANLALLYIFYLKINAKVSHEAFKSYRSLNDLYLEYSEWSFPISLKMKVSSRLIHNNIASYFFSLVRYQFL